MVSIADDDNGSIEDEKGENFYEPPLKSLEILCTLQGVLGLRRSRLTLF